MPANHYKSGHVQHGMDYRNAKLSEQFGYEYACRLFGIEAIESLPKLERGPNKGKPKGYLHWRKAMKPGYYRECAGPCKAGGLVDAWIGEFFGSRRDEAMRGQWIGRVQGLAGSRSVLTQEYRDQEIARAARAAADWEEEKREIMERLK